MCGDAAWEAAYARFQTPEQEIRKFTRRLVQLGADRWARDAEIVELCCGRGSGLHALSALGFSRLEGVDLSATLLEQYSGPGILYVCDCRQLPFGDASKDIVVVQGGLHHLPELPDDLQRTLAEASRVLRADGFIAIVEPWLTPFLAVVHTVSRITIARRLVPKIDALATMIEHERETYERWLGQPQIIAGLFEQYFSTIWCSARFGKYMFVGRNKNGKA